MPKNPDRINEVSKAFGETLNAHGYGFQHTIVVKANELALALKSPWIKPVLEFPAEVQGYGTRIDFILQHKDKPIFLLAECKRVNPALSDWCFGKAGYIPQDSLIAESYFFETLQRKEGSYSFLSGVQMLQRFDDIYHIALEVRSGNKGEASGQGRGAIEEAATQLCRGMNGLISYFEHHQKIFAKYKYLAGFVPVIFTTAQLWSSDVNLGSADTENGTIKLSEMQVKPKNWLLYNYNQSPGLKHSIPFNRPSDELQQALYDEYVRPIFIVNSLGIEDFLCSPIWKK